MVPFVFSGRKRSKTCIPEAGYGYHKDHTEVKEKKEFPCTGISYLSNVKYSSDNKKVAKVNSSGEIQAKKAGTTYIRCKVKQYGDTYNLVCKVTVKKEGNIKDPTSAYRNLIQSYEKNMGKLN